MTPNDRFAGDSRDLDLNLCVAKSLVGRECPECIIRKQLFKCLAAFLLNSDENH